MKKAKSRIEFEEYLKEIYDKLAEVAIEHLQDIDFEKVWALIEKRIQTCKDRKAKRKNA